MQNCILSSLTFDSKDTQDSTVQHINKLMPVQNLKQEAFKGTVLINPLEPKRP